MKQLVRSPALASLLLGLSLGCSEQNGPTAPVAASVNLSGAWTGTITYFQDSDGPQRACGPEALRVEISQSDARITARFETLCEGSLELSGTLDGNLIKGSLLQGSQNPVGRISGVVSSSRIEISTNRGRGDEPVAVNRIELVR